MGLGTDALVDGNKRLAGAATRAFCLLNRQDLDFTVDDAEQAVVSVGPRLVRQDEVAARTDLEAAAEVAAALRRPARDDACGEALRTQWSLCCADIRTMRSTV